VSERILWLNSSTASHEKTIQCLHAASFELDIAKSHADALMRLQEASYQVFIAQQHCNGQDCLPLLREVSVRRPETVCILLGAAATEADNCPGSFVFLSGAGEPEQLLADVQHALKQAGLTRCTTLAEEVEKTRNELLRTRERLNNLLDSTMDAVFTLGTTLEITYANRGAVRMLGYNFNEFEGMDFELLLRGAEDESSLLLTQLDDGPIQNYETELRHQGGRWVPVSISLSKAYDHLGKFVSLLAICKNITQQKQLEQKLKEKIVTDSLTGLYNQRYFYERLAAEIERARRQNHPLSLLLLDVDAFKQYNDSRGHLEGDRVLKAIGEVIRQCTRDYVDVGCRYGGDEFTVILPETDLVHAKNIAERIRVSFEARAFDQCTLSIGLMTNNKTAPDKGASAESYIRFADEMMYEAKRSGGNRVCIYDGSPNVAGPDA